jgi:hypothetical protein
VNDIAGANRELAFVQCAYRRSLLSYGEAKETLTGNRILTPLLRQQCRKVAKLKLKLKLPGDVSLPLLPRQTITRVLELLAFLLFSVCGISSETTLTSRASPARVSNGRRLIGDIVWGQMAMTTVVTGGINFHAK